MAEDTKRPEENEAPEAESKDWQWDAAAPTVDDDYLNLDSLIPETEDGEEDEAEDVQPVEEEASTEPEDEEAQEQEEIVIEEPQEEPEAETTEDDAKTSFEDGCCIICGQKIKNSESELYCNECRSKYMKVDYGASHIILSIIMIFVAVAGIVAFTATSKIAAELKKGN